MVKIGPQLMTVRERFTDNNAYEILKELNELGFTSFEVSMLPLSKENILGIKKAIDELEININALSCAFEASSPDDKKLSLLNDFNVFVEHAKILNCTNYRIGMMPAYYAKTKESLLDFAKKCDYFGEKFAKEGINLYYHNHHFEFQKIDGEFILDILKNNTKYLGFELDIHWIQRGGLNPIEYIKTFKNSKMIIHLKDYRVCFFDSDRNSNFNDCIQFAEIGEGNLPIKEIIEVGIENGCKLFFIEQDICYGKDPVESLLLSKNNISKLGFGKYF